MSATTDRRTPVDRVALAVAEVLAPAVLVAVGCIAFSLHSSPSLALGLLWAVIATVFCAAIPIWFMARGAKKGKWDGHHVRERSRRMLPLGVAVGSVIGGLVVLIAGGAPQQLVAVVVVMLVCLVTCTAITKWWKISFHASIASMIGTMLAIEFGPGMWVGLLGVAAVCWSRVRTDDHTLAQVAAGAVLGAVAGCGLLLTA